MICATKRGSVAHELLTLSYLKSLHPVGIIVFKVAGQMRTVTDHKVLRTISKSKDEAAAERHKFSGVGVKSRKEKGKKCFWKKFFNDLNV